MDDDNERMFHAEHHEEETTLEVDTTLPTTATATGPETIISPHDADLLKTELAHLFAAADIDHNEDLDLGEFTALMKQLIPDITADSIENIFQNMDLGIFFFTMFFIFIFLEKCS